MPAKQKYLSDSWQRFSKVTAAIVGSYMLTMMIHVMVIKIWPIDKSVVLTSSYTSFMMWVGFMVLAFLIKKAWHVWLLYSSLGLFCAIVIFM